MNEEEIIEEICKRVRVLLSNMNEQPGKEAWVAWGESEEGGEVLTLIKMLEVSDFYVDKFEKEL